MKKGLYIILLVALLVIVAWILSMGVNENGEFEFSGEPYGDSAQIDTDGDGEVDVTLAPDGSPVLEPREGVRPDSCTDEHVPVCGEDGYTYRNRCHAEVFAGIEVDYEGECQPE